MQIGIIGCGAIAGHHLRAVNGQPGCRVIACADVNLDSAQRFAARFQVPHVFADGESLLQLDDLDLVAVCTPPRWHAQFVLSALQHGRHVLVEKPLAMTLDEADSIVEAVDTTDRIAGVALMHRYLPIYGAVREIIAADVLGALRRIRVSLGRNMLTDSRFATPHDDSRSWLVNYDIAGGGILMSSSIHFLSVVSYLLGDPVARSVSGHARQLHPAGFPRIEDDVDLLVHWDNGVELVYRESWITDVSYRAEVIGDEGRLTITAEGLTNPTMQIDGHRKLPPPYHALDPRELITDDQLQAIVPQLRLFSGLWADLVASVRRRQLLARLPNVRHARNMQAIVAAAYQAESTSQSTSVDWLPRKLAYTM